LTNWYVRLNRDRMRGTNGPEEAATSLCTLYHVLLNVAVVMAPLTPFITELMYQNLSRGLPDGHAMKAKSVHHVMIPQPDMQAMNEKIVVAVGRMQTVVDLGRMCRERRRVGLKTPLKSMTVINESEDYMRDMKELQAYIKEELNVMEITYRTDTDDIQLSGTLNFQIVGKKLGKDMKAVLGASKTLSQEELKQFDKTGKITICGHEFTREAEEFSLSKSVKGLSDPNLEANGDDNTITILDFTEDEDLQRMAVARNISNSVNKLRKEATTIC